MTTFTLAAIESPTRMVLKWGAAKLKTAGIWTYAWTSLGVFAVGVVQTGVWVHDWFAPTPAVVQQYPLTAQDKAMLESCVDHRAPQTTPADCYGPVTRYRRTVYHPKQEAAWDLRDQKTKACGVFEKGHELTDAEMACISPYYNAMRNAFDTPVFAQMQVLCRNWNITDADHWNKPMDDCERAPLMREELAR